MVYVLCMCVMCMLVQGDVECMVYMLGMMCDMCVYVWRMCVWSGQGVCTVYVYGVCMRFMECVLWGLYMCYICLQYGLLYACIYDI